MGTVFFSALVALGVTYVLHALLFRTWRRGNLQKMTFFPLWLVSWYGVGGLAVSVGSLFYVMLMERVYEAVLPLAVLIVAFGVVYYVRDLANYEAIRPFIADSMFLRHSARVRDNVFAKVEQKDINAKAMTEKDKAVLRGMVTKRTPMDRERELQELQALRTQRKAEAGKDEIGLLQAGSKAEITDLCRLHHVTDAPHPLFEQMFRMTIDPEAHALRACIVFAQSTREGLSDAKRWFRFRQDLFDFAETLYDRDWMDRFKPFYAMLELECYQEETDSFGLPRKMSFLRVDLPVNVIERFADRVFIATELEHVATITWLEGDPG